MKEKRRTKSPVVSSPRWFAYVAAGSATALAGAQYAEAEIHYSRPVVRLTGDSYVNLPLSNGASIAFNLFGMGTTYQQAALFFIGGAISGSARAYAVQPAGTAILSNVDLRDFVSNGSFGPVLGSQGDRGAIFSYGADYQFVPDGGIIGFKFNTGRGTQYGWVRVKLDFVFRTHEQLRVIVEDFAWGDPGDTIQAGQKRSASEQADAVSKNASLGLLALGARGLMAWRQARTTAPEK